MAFCSEVLQVGVETAGNVACLNTVCIAFLSPDQLCHSIEQIIELKPVGNNKAWQYVVGTAMGIWHEEDALLLVKEKKLVVHLAIQLCWFTVVSVSWKWHLFPEHQAVFHFYLCIRFHCSWDRAVLFVLVWWAEKHYIFPLFICPACFWTNWQMKYP